MSKKTYSFEHMLKVYDINVDSLNDLIDEKFEGIAPEEIPASLNNEIAMLLGVQPKRLNPIPKKKKVLKKEKPKSLKRKKEVIPKKKKTYKTEISQIENSKYKEKIEEYFEELKTKINSAKIMEEINQAFEALPDKKQYLKVDCEKIYFTWKDMTFTNKGVKVDPNIVYLTINIDGPTNILNDIKVSYFQRKYDKTLYKVYINKNSKKIEYFLSSDIRKIKDIVSKHIISKETLSKKTTTRQTIGSHTHDNYNTTKQISIKDITRLYQNNNYIKESSKFLKTKDTAFALWENNNSVFEEAILFVFYRKVHVYVIWENINENRACYIFKYKPDKFKKKINNLKKFINTDIEYKRWDLFNNKGNTNSLKYEEYYTVIHECEESYKRKIHAYLKH